jgi:hypothetical protein
MILSTAFDAITLRAATRGSMAAAGVVTGLLLAPSTSMAQPATKDRAAAEVLFKEARDLVKAGSWAEACPKFEASLALSASASAMLNIARCHEHDGKLATAWSDYNRALTLNGETEGEERRAELEGIAKLGLAALEPRVPKLRIVVTAPPLGLTIRRDGQELPAAALGEALPADPGPHEVSAAAPGRRPETRSAILTEGKTTTIEITLAAAPDRAAPTRPTGLRPLGIALTAVGAVGLGVGAATGILSLDKVRAVKASCGGVSCLSNDVADQDNVSQAMMLGNVSTASFVAGGVLAAAGVVLLLVRSGEIRPSASSAFACGVTLGPGRVELQGSF